MKKMFFVLFLIIVSVSACTVSTNTNIQEKDTELNTPEARQTWQFTQLQDVATDRIFTINDFDKPVLMESFAVWCPTCTRQQSIIKEFHEEVGDSVVSISVNTDPNEDKEKVKQHIEENEFDWYYAVAPREFTQSLIDEFGVSIVNAPSVPMVLICPDGSFEMLQRGIKTVDELKSHTQTC